MEKSKLESLNNENVKVVDESHKIEDLIYVVTRYKYFNIKFRRGEFYVSVNYGYILNHDTFLLEYNEAKSITSKLNEIYETT